MAAEGIFHDAHEVYAIPPLPGEEKWVGTLATQELAEGFARVLTSATEGYRYEVRPV